ncbi:MAG: ribosome small subunit-dependent GTPase A [bacterium]
MPENLETEARDNTEGDAEGRVAAMYADRCLVLSDGEEVVCAVRGRFKGRGRPKEQLTPVVGDRVRIARNPDGSGTVTVIEPRTRVLTRRQANRKRVSRSSQPQVLAANVDLLVVVASLRRPPLRTGLVDRFLAAAAMSEIPPLICITKLDLDPGGEFEAVREAYAGLEILVLGTDIHRPETLDPLSDALRGSVSVLVGHSGVGKTSLLNILAGMEMQVREVGFQKDRGRHTTSTARLISLSGGGFAIDSPGIREFGLHGVEPAELAELYPDFRPYLDDCGFRDCLHQGEPGCSLVAALKAGHLTEARYAGYRKLLDELREV